MIFGSWDTEWDRHWSHWAIPFPFTNTPHPPYPPPLQWSKKSKFKKKKMKKIPGDIIFLYIHVYHKWRSYHMIYGSWNIRCDRQKFSSFWAIFCPFSPLTTWKIKILTLKKTPEDIIILHISTIWFLRYQAQQKEFFCHFGPFFALLPT